MVAAYLNPCEFNIKCPCLLSSIFKFSGQLLKINVDKFNIVTGYVSTQQASTSEMFGKVKEIPQTENTPFYPRSPYGKLSNSV